MRIYNRIVKSILKKEMVGKDIGKSEFGFYLSIRNDEERR